VAYTDIGSTDRPRKVRGGPGTRGRTGSGKGPQAKANPAGAGADDGNPVPAVLSSSWWADTRYGGHRSGGRAVHKDHRTRVHADFAAGHKDAVHGAYYLIMNVVVAGLGTSATALRLPRGAPWSSRPGSWRPPADRAHLALAPGRQSGRQGA